MLKSFGATFPQLICHYSAVYICLRLRSHLFWLVILSTWRPVVYWIVVVWNALLSLLANPSQVCGGGVYLSIISYFFNSTLFCQYLLFFWHICLLTIAWILLYWILSSTFFVFRYFWDSSLFCVISCEISWFHNMVFAVRSFH